MVLWMLGEEAGMWPEFWLDIASQMVAVKELSKGGILMTSSWEVTLQYS